MMMNIFTKEKLHKICSNFEHITTVKKKKWIWLWTKFGSSSWLAWRGWVQGLNASFGRQRVVGGSGSDYLFVKVLNLLFVHLRHNRPLQLHGRACRVQSVTQLAVPGLKCTQTQLCSERRSLPSSPPLMEKSRSRMVHFWMRWAFEVDFLLTALIPSWMAAWTARSLPPVISDTRVALLPTLRQNSTASGVSSSSGSPESGFILHCWGIHENAQSLMLDQRSYIRHWKTGLAR